MGLEGGVGKRLLLRHVISLDLFPAGPLAFCCDWNVGVSGRAAFDLIYLDAAVFALGFSVLSSDLSLAQIPSAPGIHDLSFPPPFTPIHGKFFPVWNDTVFCL